MMKTDQEVLSPQLRKQLRDLQLAEQRCQRPEESPETKLALRKLSTPVLTECQKSLMSLAGKQVPPAPIYSQAHPRDSQSPEFQKLYQKDLDAALRIKARLLAMISSTEVMESRETAQ